MKKIFTDIEKYYSKKLEKFGAIPKGVDWNSEEGQILRFEVLSKVILEKKFSISDIGCGYGKYYEFLKNQGIFNFEYYGYDLSEEMIKKANDSYIFDNARFIKISNLKNIKETDYIVSSGIFNVKMDYNDSEWLSYIIETLDVINAKSIKGFSFNILSSYSDKDFMRKDLFYGDPLFFFDYCKKNYSKEVSLLHDYQLYEFTILVRKRSFNEI